MEKAERLPPTRYPLHALSGRREMVYRSDEDPQISPHKRQNRNRSDDRHYSGAGCRDGEAAWELRARQDDGRKWALRLSSVHDSEVVNNKGLNPMKRTRVLPAPHSLFLCTAYEGISS